MGLFWVESVALATTPSGDDEKGQWAALARGSRGVGLLQCARWEFSLGCLFPQAVPVPGGTHGVIFRVPSAVVDQVRQVLPVSAWSGSQLPRCWRLSDAAMAVDVVIGERLSMLTVRSYVHQSGIQVPQAAGGVADGPSVLEGTSGAAAVGDAIPLSELTHAAGAANETALESPCAHPEDIVPGASAPARTCKRSTARLPGHVMLRSLQLAPHVRGKVDLECAPAAWHWSNLTSRSVHVESVVSPEPSWGVLFA